MIGIEADRILKDPSGVRESGRQTQTELLDLLEELKTLRVDFDSARAQLGEEFKKLGAVTITYLR